MNTAPPKKVLDAIEYDAITRMYFWVFVQRVVFELTGEHLQDNWHIQLLCGEVDRIRTDPNTLLGVSLPPRSLKSIIMSVALPAWLLGHDPSIEVVCVSYGQELANEFAEMCRRVMLSPWYRRLFPQVELTKIAVGHLITSKGGKRYATSIGGSLTGIGADVIIVDDGMKPEEAYSDVERTRINKWIRHTLFSRSNKKADLRIVVTQQRLHEDDMIGNLSQFSGFEILNFPAIAQEDETHIIKTPFGTLTHVRKEGEALHPARESLEVLAGQLRLLGEEEFRSQYLGQPSPPGGVMVKIVWFGRFDLELQPPFVRIVQSWDCASKVTQTACYSVCTTWGVMANGNIYLLHVFRAQLEYPDLKRKMRELAIRFGVETVLIEDASAGTQLIQELQSEGFARLRAIKPKGEKKFRMLSQTAAIEAGRVFIPHQAPWLETYLHELAMFPRGKLNDQVDSTSQALAFLINDPASQWLETMAQVEALRANEQDAERNIRVNHPEKELTFFLQLGRPAEREADGSFLVTAEELEYLRNFAGLIIIDE